MSLSGEFSTISLAGLTAKMQSELDVRRLLALHIRKGRMAKGWTQQILSEQSELPRTYIADLECARRNPSLKSVVRLANALRVPVQDLFGPAAQDANGTGASPDGDQDR